MKRLAALCMLMVCICSCARAELRTYGGSGDDVVNAMAVGADGTVVITGYTDSSDGTLSERTKTGRSGWVMCMDALGSVRWNFCSRHDVQDTMVNPVIHEDGSISVILISADAGSRQVSEEWIHLSPDGDVLAREMIEGDGGVLFYTGGSGYVQAETGETQRHFYLIPWGSVQRVPLAIDAASDVQMEEMSGRYFLLDSWDDGRMLYAFDEQMHGGEWAVRSGMPEERTYRRLLELRDGGLAAIGRVSSEYNAERCFTRWDAAGNVLTDCLLEADIPSLLCETEDGLLLLDFWGQLTKLRMDGSVAWSRATEAVSSLAGMALMPDGKLLIAFTRKEEGAQDVHTLRLDIE